MVNATPVESKHFNILLCEKLPCSAGLPALTPAHSWHMKPYYYAGERIIVVEIFTLLNCDQKVFDIEFQIFNQLIFKPMLLHAVTVNAKETNTKHLETL